MRPVASNRTGARRALAAWILAVAALVAVPAHAQVRNESLVTGQFDLIDSEYSQSRAMLTWCDVTGALWVADIDRDTGLFVPANGKGTLIDPQAMLLDDLQIVGNGPEWVSTATGDQIVYSKFLPGEEHSLRTARLAAALQLGDGSWAYSYMSPALRRNGPYSSHDPGDPLPRITYVDSTGNHYWRNLYDASSETLMPLVPRSRRSVRFVEGDRAVVFDAPVAGVDQVFLQSLDTGIATQVTFDDGEKDLHTAPWGWYAPEFGGDLTAATVVDDTDLRIYRRSGPAGGETWSLVNSIRTPQQGIISSPEPLIHNGKSYIVFSAAMPPHTEPTAIFLASTDPAEPLVVQLTPDWPLRIRRDPEIFIANDGPYIYYNRLHLSGQRFCLSCNEGVYRSYTGLPPAQE